MRTQNGRDLCKLENAHEDRQCKKRKQEWKSSSKGNELK